MKDKNRITKTEQPFNSLQGVIEKLCSGYSNQSKIVNTFWSLLVVTSAIIILSTYEKDNLIKIPILLISLETTYYYSISIIIITIFTIGFSSAMTQSIRIRKLIDKTVSSSNKKIAGNIDIRDLVDSILNPTYNKVAPIGQLMIGENQFFNDGPQVQSNRNLGIVTYLVLKINIILFLYGLPILAFIKSWAYLIEVYDYKADTYLFYCILLYPTLLSVILISFMFIYEFKYTIKVIKHLRKEKHVDAELSKNKQEEE